MTKDDTDKIRKKLHLVESELAGIKNSRPYKLAKGAAVLKNKVKKDPAAFTKKTLQVLFTDPRRILRLVRGREANTALVETINNRAVTYHSWIAINEPGVEELEAQKKASQQFASKPVISILTPVFDPPVPVLTDLIESVLGQTYPYFELCLGNFGKSMEVKALLDEYAARDDRVKVYEFTQNLGIAGNSNLILEKVQGDFIGLLDHDDTLAPNALYENVRLLNEAPYDFIYSDKDMIDEQGNRYEPLFKPNLSPEMMLNANYLTHFDVMRTVTVKEVGGWDSSTDGAQDWDLFLKIMTATDRIIHISKILYHWRVIATSTAHSIETKPYALKGQRVAVQKYLDMHNIQAEPYHTKTELLLKWKDAAIDTAPLLVITMHALSNTKQVLARLRRTMPEHTTIIVLHSQRLDGKDEQLLRAQGVKKFLHYEADQYGAALSQLAAYIRHKESLAPKVTLFVDDSLQIPHNFDFNGMTGWLSINGVAIVGAKVLNHDNAIADCGSVITPKGIAPLFYGRPSYYQGYIGNVEWVRNLRVVSRDIFACTTASLLEANFDHALPDDSVAVDFMLQVSQKSRLMTYPKAVAYASEHRTHAVSSALLPRINAILAGEPTPGVDAFSNPNLLSDDVMRLNTEHGADGPGDEDGDEIDAYQHDALILSRTFDLTQEDLQANANHAAQPLANPKTVGWIVPSFNAIYAGLNNIFSFAAYMQAEKGLQTHFFILKGGGDASTERDLVAEKYPQLQHATFTALTPDEAERIPKLDIGICTLWSTAFVLAKATSITRKCYFIQDNEVNFYPMGSISALVDVSYRLNFFAIANTPGLLDMYKKTYGGRGVVVKSLVDLSTYQPSDEPYATSSKPYRVFFYGRPTMPRNAFELCLAGLIELKRQMGESIEIVSAGADWKPRAYGVEGIVENMGKIPYAELPDFYRSVDAGMMFMFSGHPGVVASELMASGCPVVVNDYDDITWKELYQHEQTCLVTVPTASEIARNLRRCLEDTALRRTLIDGGLQKVASFYDGYEASRERAFDAIKQG